MIYDTYFKFLSQIQSFFVLSDLQEILFYLWKSSNSQKLVELSFRLEEYVRLEFTY